MGEGNSNQESAERLVITLHAVKQHRGNIYAKLWGPPGPRQLRLLSKIKR